MVVIVDDPEKGLDEDNLKAREGGSSCQHLKGDKSGEFSCAIHDYPWYEETPCFAHTQIEDGNTDCRIGEHVLSHNFQAISF